MTSNELNDSNLVEVDRIIFKSLVPEQRLHIPKYGEETPVKFGVHITKKTSSIYRFDLPLFLP
ncbi:MAG: hypothetical protein QNJ47_13685 [Nostocaceae cyanobacterium]|nr:hypothetical protein [Nostocaceae cyanobacterium]